MKVLLILSLIFAYSTADTPANCTYGEVQGKWALHVIDSETCDGKGKVEYVTTVDLSYPDVAIDEYGNEGFWTMVYNQGFEVVINGRKYFAFSKWEGKGENATSYCGETMPGQSHDTLGRHWNCFFGVKQGDKPAPKLSTTNLKMNEYQQKKYVHDKEFIAKINNVQSLWKAGHYKQYEDMSVAEMMLMAGGTKTVQHPSTFPPKQPVSEEVKRTAASLPTHFDWRDFEGQDYVSPVRNQGGCGSCYAFSSMGQLEARIKIAFKNRYPNITLSPQDIVDCSIYSQGCDGGFPYLIAGKYAEDFGVVDEKCNPYTGDQAEKCDTKDSCYRFYATNYRYVGGYYGACSEEEMKIALYNNGPVSVAFEVYADFMAYKGGIYKRTNLESRFNPFEITNHAVLAVGWGEEKGVPYWIVKNSWGEGWGENGYFRIIRGQDECAIESIAVETFPIF